MEYRSRSFPNVYLYLYLPGNLSTQQFAFPPQANKNEHESSLGANLSVISQVVQPFAKRSRMDLTE